jgi:hypothetical protein
MIKKLFAILFGLMVLSNICHAESYKIYLGIPAGGMTDVFLRKILDVVHTYSMRQKKRTMSFLSTADHCYQYKRWLYEVIYALLY